MDAVAPPVPHPPAAPAQAAAASAALDAAAWAEVAASVRHLLAEPLRPPPVPVVRLHNRIYKLTVGRPGAASAQAAAAGGGFFAHAAMAATAGGWNGDRQANAEALYDRFCDEVAGHVKHTVVPALITAARRAAAGAVDEDTPQLAGVSAPAATGTGGGILVEYCGRWRAFELSLRALSAVFSYASSVWGSRAAEREASAAHVGHRVWRKHVLGDQNLVTALIEAAAAVPAEERSAMAVLDTVAGVADVAARADPTEAMAAVAAAAEAVAANPRRRLLRDFVISLSVLGRPDSGGPYELLGQRYVADTAAYLSDVAARLSAVEDAAGVLRRLAAVSDLEARRLGQCLLPSTAPAVQAAWVTTTLRPRMATVRPHLATWLAADRRAELWLLFRLAAQDTATLDEVCDALKGHVKRSGREALDRASGPPVGSAAEAAAFAEAAAAEISRFERLAAAQGEAAPKALAAVQEGCAAFINGVSAFASTSARAAELVARYADGFLPPSASRAADVEAGIASLGALLQAVEDRDVFQARYTELLAMRLIRGTFATETELEAVHEIKRVTAHDYTYKWARMLQDVAAVEATKSEFLTHLDDAVAGPERAALAAIDFTPMALRQGSWPLVRAPMLPPPGIEGHLTRFEQWHSGRHESKRLTWAHSLGHGALRPTFNRDVTFVAAMPQAAVLLHFNSVPGPEPEVTVAALAAATGTTPDELRRTLALLRRVKIISLHAARPGAATADFAQAVVRLRLDFTSRERKIRLTALEAGGDQRSGGPGGADPAAVGLPDSTAAATAAAEATLAKERNPAVQAAVIRVLKSRHRLPESLVVQETKAALLRSFVAPAAQVQRQIEMLLDKEYIAVVDPGAEGGQAAQGDRVLEYLAAS